jgi:hypothetical protein
MTPEIHLPQVEWTTIVSNVVVVSSTNYKLTVAPNNVNDIGVGVKEVGFYIRDYVGHTYSIVALNVDGNSDRIEAKDDFNIGINPQSGQQAIVYKSVGGGKAPYVGPVRYRKLDKTAEDYARAIEMDILYRNKGDVDRLENLTSRSVSVIFKGYYKEVPIGKSNTRVYREEELEEGKPTINTVLFHSHEATTEGFTLEIDESEELEGIIIEYNFNSAT